MTLYRVEDTAGIDAFTLPSIFDNKARFYQEWHDFVFFDRKTGIFGLLNFGIHGNPYDSKRGWGSVLTYIVDPAGNITSKIKLIPLSELEISSYSPDFISENFSVTFLKDNSFSVKGDMEEISWDLIFQVAQPPMTEKDIFFKILKEQDLNEKMIFTAREMNRQWENWVELPRLVVKGTLKIDTTTYPIETNQGYQDHEGGCFDIGTTWGWDTGVILCDPSVVHEPERADFLIYRYGPASDLSYGGIVIETKNGESQFFDTMTMDITASGNYNGNLNILPDITKLLYPDYRPVVAKKKTFTIANGSDHLEIIFTPKAVCSIVKASLISTTEIVFNEMFCDATIRGKIGGSSYDCTLPCWFESVRPRKKG